jgi:hypothetical protein
MIPYDLLCQSIAEFKAGQRPSASQSNAPQEVMHVDSSIMEMDEEAAIQETVDDSGSYEETDIDAQLD